MDYKTLSEKITYFPESGDFARLTKSSHNASPSGSVNKHGYIVFSVAGKPYYAHRLAHLLMTGDWPKGQIDHINGDRSDNTWSNLRDVDHADNQRNLHGAQKNSRSGYLGVMYMGDKRRGKKYAARIHRKGERHELGYYETAEEAHEAYMKAKKEFDK